MKAVHHTVGVSKQRGFTYIGLLIAVAIMGITLATIGTFWHTTRQRAQEQQLLFVGNQYAQAIFAYYQNTPGADKQFPQKLEDLLLDKRQPYTTRYLRKLFADPITGSKQWGLIKGADGGIIGVHSLSAATPLKKDNFGRGYEKFAGKKRYADWQFTFSGSSYTPVFASEMTAGKLGAAGMSLPTTADASANIGAAGNNKPNSNVPPAYQVPPPTPLPPEPTTSERKLFMCQNMRVNDANTCALLAKNFGDASGLICMGSAAHRYTVCTSTDIVALPTLIVVYK